MNEPAWRRDGEASGATLGDASIGWDREVGYESSLGTLKGPDVRAHEHHFDAAASDGVSKFLR